MGSSYTDAAADDYLNHSTPLYEDDKPAAWQTWGIGLLIVTISAFASPAGILLVPLFSKRIYDLIMSFLIALGIGALSGSILFIMLPQGFKAADYDGNDYFVKSSITLGALYLFFFIDRAMQYMVEVRRRIRSRAIHSATLNMLVGSEQTSGDSSYCSTKPIVCDDDETRDIIIKEVETLAADIELTEISNAIARRMSTRRRLPVIQKMRSRTATMRSRAPTCLSTKSLALNGLPITVPPPEDTVSVAVAVVEKVVVDPTELEISTVAYMIIFGSTANNFVDGLNNGVAFADSLVRGLSLGLACITQQFPQELGTLAILVQSGLGMKRALLLNLIPGAFSYMGFTIGALIDNSLEDADDYVFMISSGMYLYVFLGTLVPEVRESMNELIKTNMRESVLVTVLQAVGIAVGVVIMFVMARYGTNIHV